MVHVRHIFDNEYLGNGDKEKITICISMFDLGPFYSTNCYVYNTNTTVP